MIPSKASWLTACPKCRGHRTEWYDCSTHGVDVWCYELWCETCDSISRDCEEVTA